MLAITATAPRSTRGKLPRRTTKMPTVVIETARSTNGAQYASTAEAREKNTSSVPRSSAAITPKPMPRRPLAARQTVDDRDAGAGREHRRDDRDRPVRQREVERHDAERAHDAGDGG